MKTLNLIVDWLSYDGAPTNDPADSIRLKNKIVDSKIANVSRQQLQIADATSNLAITLPDNESQYMAILADQTISIILNGSEAPLTLTPISNTVKTLVFFNNGPITALTVSNSSGATANIDIIIATH
jgi:hypothetical protein